MAKVVYVFDVAQGRDGVRGLLTPDVCRLAEVAPSTLNYWIKQGLVRPTHLESAGKRFPRAWTVEDLVTVRAVKALREAGCPLQRLRRAKDELRRVLGSDLTGVVLYWDGGDVLAVDQWGDVYSLIGQPGQGILHVVAIPLGPWLEVATREARMIDVEEMQARRERRVRGRTETAQLRTPGAGVDAASN
jgi:DNA-binding transcriptional MerR regulator